MMIFGCTGTLEKDARNLAVIQKQKNETVRKMLGCKDSLQKLDLLEEIVMLENQFNLERKLCTEKYDDSASSHAFEQYYKNYLSNISN